MGVKRTIKLPSVANVAAGATCSLDIPVGGVKYHSISLAVTNITNAQLDNIELRLNGKPFMKFADLAELDALNKFHGRGAAANGIYTIHFGRPELKNYAERALTAIGTKDVSTFSLHGDIDAACASPAIVAYAEQELADDPLGLIVKVKRFPASFAVTGQVEIPNIPRSGARIAAIHCKKSDVSALEIDVNSVRYFEGTKTVVHQIAALAGKTAQAGYTHADFCLAGTLQDALRTQGVQDLRLRPTLDTSGSVDIIVEYLDGLAGI